MKDFLGQEYVVGDHVVYATLSGRSVTQTLGIVVAITDKSVVVRPVFDSRGWRVPAERQKRTRYIDSRTGKGIDVSFVKHHERVVGWVHKGTGEFIDFEAMDALSYPDGKPVYGYGYGWHDLGKNDLKRQYADKVLAQYDRAYPIYKDYVQEVVETGAKPVKLSVTENIVKVDYVSEK